MSMRDVVDPAIQRLCTAFDRHGYNPTPIIDLGVLVAYADGSVDARERAVLLDLFQSLLETNLTPELVDHLITASLEVIEAAGPESRARLIAAILSDCDAVESGVLLALAVAFASEGLSSAELGVIERIANGANLGKPRLNELIQKVRAKVDGNPVSVRESLGPTPPRSESA